MKKTFLFKLFSLGLCLNLFQPKAEAQLFFPMNFFIGEGAETMETTFRGLGSTNTPIAALGIPFSINLTNRSDVNAFHVYFRTGILYRWVKFRFDQNNFVWNRNNGQTSFGLDQDPNRSFGGFHSKSKLVCGYLNLPLGIGFSKGWGFFGDIGADLDVLMGGRAKRKFFENGERRTRVDRFRDNESFGINPWQVSGNLRLGYWAIFAYGSYNFLPFFKAGQAPVGVDVRVASFGIGIDLFRALGYFAYKAKDEG